MSIWDQWKTTRCECPPVGHVLRMAFPARWLRIHNLPQSKRYPETAAEEQEVLHRNNVVASALLGAGTECLAIVTEWEPLQRFASWHLAETPPPWSLDDDLREELATASFRWRTLRWRPGDFDSEILARARDKVGSLIVFSPPTGNVYCPYDGGADLILAEPADAKAFQRLFAAWRSSLPSGL